MALDNKNIEIINDSIWAFSYALFPLITDLNYVPDPESPAPPLKEPYRYVDGGIVLLNKDFRHYQSLCDVLQDICRWSSRRIDAESSRLYAMNEKSAGDSILFACLVIEKGRRLRKTQSSSGGILQITKEKIQKHFKKHRQ